MSDAAEVEPRLFFLAQNCKDCPKALFDFGDEEDDEFLGEWVKTNLSLAEEDHAVLNGRELVYRSGKLRHLLPGDEEMWDGSIPDDVLLTQIERTKITPAHLQDLKDKRGNLPVDAFL